MWFAFGFVTFISFFIYQFYKNLDASWKGEDDSYDGVKYQSKELKHKGKITGLKVGIAGKNGYDFSFKNENWLDRLGKSVGLSKEHQTGYKEFDDLIYVVSDCENLHRQVSNNKEITKNIVDLFNYVEDQGLTFQEVKSNKGRIWVELNVPSSFQTDKLNKIKNQTTKYLKTLSESLIETYNDSNTFADPFVLKAGGILSISTALAINGFVQLFRIDWGYFPFTVDSEALFNTSLILGGGITFILILLTFSLLGKSARTHLVMIELLTIGLFGSISTSFAELRDINIELDNSNKVVYEAKLVKKHSSRSRNSTNYYFYISDWTEHSGSRKIEVGYSDYKKYKRGEELLLSQYAGYLNYRWVESFSRKY